MNNKNYFKDNFYAILIFLFSYLVIVLICLAFKLSHEIIISLSFIYILENLLLYTIGYLRKRTFYNKLIEQLATLDQKYLIVEMLPEASFLEAKIYKETLYEINKSMLEKIKEYKNKTQDFKEYVELWIHEVKLPVSSLFLMSHNYKKNKKLLEQIIRLDNYLEEILYYTRSENAEKDYLIASASLKKIIHNVALKNKDIILESNIDLIVKNVDVEVLTDAKWLEFIINQIINNSIKYRKSKKPYIKISTEENKDYINLLIYDNGLGIKESELKRVFEKTFTGTNGHKTNQSTGMGLYIVKQLCNKLSHQIAITSEENKFTCVKISFSKDEYYKVLKN